MYLAPELLQARVLITVKTYPQPSGKYGELVCTAGLFEGEKWIRIYPIPYRFLEDSQQYPKYGWVRLDLVRNPSDFRVESYRPRQGLDADIRVENKLSTAQKWAARKEYVLREVFTSMQEIIHLAKGEQQRSLATLKPLEIVAFEAEETERQWKEQWLAQSRQGSFFELDEQGQMRERRLVRKLPYRYYYKFLTEGDQEPRRLMIADWEIGALYWNCLRRTNGDEIAANKLVRQKYFDTFTARNDLYLFLGTTQQYHRVAPNPFIIIGVFYPPKESQTTFL